MEDITEKAINKAEDFAKITAPIYKELDWNWRGNVPTEQEIKEHILYHLFPAVKREALKWNLEDEKSYMSSSGGIVVIGRTYKNQHAVEINVLFDISRTKKISWNV